ncbi:MAG TPA: hypothetical protein VMH80_03450 [Bryobacteraceae bacterium]|nr:hypothetical protein [Bryobacteraceae bacterium]
MLFDTTQRQACLQELFAIDDGRTLDRLIGALVGAELPSAPWEGNPKTRELVGKYLLGLRARRDFVNVQRRIGSLQ